jgi:hypothetical protein
MAAGWLGLEAEPVEAPYPEVDQLSAGARPALVRLPGEAEPRFLALLSGNRRWVTVLTPDLTLVRLAPASIRAALCRPVEAPVAGDVERILAAAGVRGKLLATSPGGVTVHSRGGCPSLPIRELRCDSFSRERARGVLPALAHARG